MALLREASKNHFFSPNKNAHGTDDHADDDKNPKQLWDRTGLGLVQQIGLETATFEDDGCERRAHGELPKGLVQRCESFQLRQKAHRQI